MPRHSGNPTAVLRLRVSDGEVVLDVAGAGKGLRLEQLAGGVESQWGVGIAGRRERRRHLRGHLELKSGGAGTVVRYAVRNQFVEP